MQKSQPPAQILTKKYLPAFFDENAFSLTKNASVFIVIHGVGFLSVSEIFKLEIFPDPPDARLNMKRFAFYIHAAKAAQNEIDKGGMIIILSAVFAARNLAPLFCQRAHVPNGLEGEHHLVYEVDSLSVFLTVMHLGISLD